MVFISIHSSFSCSPFPIRLFVLIRLTSLNNLGYTWIGDQSTNFVRLREGSVLKDSYLCIPEIREGSDDQDRLWFLRTWMLKREINNLSHLTCQDPEEEAASRTQMLIQIFMDPLLDVVQFPLFDRP